ncbi:hypothetical protein [Glutamicibacter sp. NPDC087344]|uniref:hypothetical protein n=1 Tax=Glutamicibacter sp. NPDC087344 TaxID=3363994 RepID=UPI00381768E3
MKRNKVTVWMLELAGKVHPLLGPIFRTRPGAEIDAEHAPNGLATGKCEMCLVLGIHTRTETVLPTGLRKDSGVCLHHDLMLNQAVEDGTEQIVDNYTEEICARSSALAAIRPFWMPRRMFFELRQRARRLHRKCAAAYVYDFLIPIFDRRANERTREAELLEAQIAAQRAQNITDGANGP